RRTPRRPYTTLFRSCRPHHDHRRETGDRRQAERTEAPGYADEVSLLREVGGQENHECQFDHFGWLHLKWPDGKPEPRAVDLGPEDRKSTRLNSSHAK